MKSIILIFTLIVSFQANALSIPSAPSSPTGSDEIRTSDGATCRSSVGGNLQIYGGIVDASGDRNQDGDYWHRYDEDERGAYIGFAYSFGGESRIRCDRLAEIETERAELELEKLKAEIEMLKKVKELEILKASGILPEL